MNEQINIGNDRDLGLEDAEGHGRRFIPAPEASDDAEDAEGHARRFIPKPQQDEPGDTEGHGRRGP